MNLYELIERMDSCEQYPGHSTLDHGVSVFVNMSDLVRGQPRGPVPQWYLDHRESIVAEMPARSVWGAYAIYHDCGKWKVREVDSDGRQHFPNHARVSSELWLSVTSMGHYGNNSNRRQRSFVADLMRNDMAMHTLTAEQLRDSVIMRHIDLASTLLISSVAELHANAPMFGGFESSGFKIKAKHVKRRGAQVCRRFFGADGA